MRTMKSVIFLKTFIRPEIVRIYRQLIQIMEQLMRLTQNQPSMVETYQKRMQFTHHRQQPKILSTITPPILILIIMILFALRMATLPIQPIVRNSYFAVVEIMYRCHVARMKRTTYSSKIVQAIGQRVQQHRNATTMISNWPIQMTINTISSARLLAIRHVPYSMSHEIFVPEIWYSINRDRSAFHQRH